MNLYHGLIHMFGSGYSTLMGIQENGYRIIGINYINNLQKNLLYFNKIEGPVTGLIIDRNSYVKKPIQVMQIEDLGKLTKIKKCSKSND